MRDNPNYPASSDFIYSVICCTILCGLRWITVNGPFYYIANFIVPHYVEARTDRLVKSSQYIFKLIFDVAFSFYGWKLLSVKEFTPPQLLGAGRIEECWLDPSLPNAGWDLRMYYQISMGYHLHSFVFHTFFTKRRNDFVEMLLHHLCTLYLIWFSYSFNQLRSGSLIILLHDISDIPGHMVRIFVDSSYKEMTYISYALLLLLWGYFRLYVFPFVVLRSVLIDTTLFNPDGRPVPMEIEMFLLMLVILVILHSYWYGLFIKMGFTAKKTGKTEDIVGKIGSEKSKAI
jgi:ceramide synthetase